MPRHGVEMREEIAGYAIEGARGARDRMTERPDRIDEGELRGALRPGFPWGDIVTLAVTDNTSRVAMEMAENGAPHGTVVVALVDAIRRNPDHLRGKLLVRLRIDPSEKVQHAELADGSFAGSAFVDAVLAKARRWTFEPTGGRTEDVIYPFVFLLPK